MPSTFVLNDRTPHRVSSAILEITTPQLFPAMEIIKVWHVPPGGAEYTHPERSPNPTVIKPFDFSLINR